MSAKLSLKLLKSTVTEEMTYDQIVESLDEQEAVYGNELALQGTLLQSVEKGQIVVLKGNAEKKVSTCVFGPKPRSSGGGGAPTTLYGLNDVMDPSKGFSSQPYSDEAFEENPLLATTQLQAVKNAKSNFYNTVYVPQLEKFRLAEEALSPVRDEDETEAAE